MVRYRVKAGQVQENEQLVRAVYDELAEVQPDGFRYATFKLEDGVSFMHLASQADGIENPLPGLPAFARFQQDIAARCDEQPAVMPLAVVGSYGMLEAELTA